MLVPEEDVGQEELNEIRRLKKEVFEGEIVSWNGIKEKVRKLIK